MASESAIGKAVYALRELQKIGELHRDMEPIQYVVSVWRNLLMDCPQTSISIGKNCDGSCFVESTSPERETNRAYGLRTTVAHKSKPFGLSIAIQDLAGNNLEISFRPSVTILDVSAIEADH